MCGCAARELSIARTPRPLIGERLLKGQIIAHSEPRLPFAIRLHRPKSRYDFGRTAESQTDAAYEEEAG